MVPVNRASGALALLFVLPGAARAATLRVPSEYSTIQAAINAGSEGDTVLVAPGTYRGAGNRNLEWTDKNIVLTSEAGPEATILDGEGLYGRGILIRPNDVVDLRTVVEGLTFRRGRTRMTPGAGIFCANYDGITIRNCRFEYNVGERGEHGEGASGTGISCVKCIISDCVFYENSGSGFGGGVQLQDGRMLRCVFIGNGAEHGGGASLWGSLAEECVFESNGAHGGALHLTYANATNCRFVGNNGPRGGAVFAVSSQVVSSEFIGNWAWPTAFYYEGDGGAVYGGGGSVVLENCSFWGNHAAGTGAAVHAIEEANVEIRHSIIAGSAGGKPMSCAGAAVMNATCTDLFGNLGGDWVGCLEGQEGVSGNFSADPLFCGPESGDLTLGALSPCLPGRHPGGEDCGLIGAMPVGCSGPTAAAPLRWGALKTRFKETPAE